MTRSFAAVTAVICYPLRMGISERPWGYFVDDPAPSDTVSCVGGSSEAIEVKNDIEYGLSARIVSSIPSEVNHYIKKADFSAIKANEKTTGFELHILFGGKKHLQAKSIASVTLT